MTKASATISWSRIEHVPAEHYYREVDAEYEITGTVHFGSRGSRNDPPDHDEVELIDTVRINSDGTQTDIPYAEWPFNAKELDAIENKVHQAATENHEEPDEDPPDYDD